MKMATKTKKMKFEVTVTVELDPERIQEWRDEYPGAKVKVTQKDVVEMVREAVDVWVNGGPFDRGMGDGYCGDPSAAPAARSCWIASMSPKIKVK